MSNIKTEGTVVGAHIRILKILREKGPLTRAELQKELEWPPTTLKNRLDRLDYLKEIRKLEDGRYAMYDYVKYEDLIKNVLKGMGCTEKEFVTEDVLKQVAMEINADYKDEEYIKSFKKVMKDWKLSWAD